MKHILLLFLIGFSIYKVDAQTLEHRYIAHDNEIREYLVYIPSTYNELEASALIFVFHGFGSSGELMQGVGLNAYAETNGYIIVYPEALPTELATVAWNCGSLLSKNVDDVGFVNTLLDALLEEFNINERRVYACGFSLGGMMSHRMACESSDRFAAIAAVGAPIATSVGNACHPIRPVPVMYFHGTGDLVLPYVGSAIIGSASANFTLSKWAKANDCPDDEVIIEQVPDTMNDQYHVEKRTVGSCDESGEIIHYKIYGWGHYWPLNGSNINATDEMVKFFEKHVMPEVETPTATITQELPKGITIGPNPFKEVVNISVSNDLTIDSWSIYASNGMKVLSGHEAVSIDAQALPTGLYILMLNLNKQVFTIELIKQ
ncbi:MAG: PHB depolymerase family esterase [Chitinophagales bacterium]